MGENADLPPALHVVTEAGSLERLRLIAEIVAIVAAGIWAFYTFVYTERIKPAFEPIAFEITPTLERDRGSGPTDFVTLHVVLRNVGTTPIDVAGDAFNVFGEVLAKTPGRHVTVAGAHEIDDDRTLPTVATTLLEGVGELRDGAVNGRRGSHILLRPEGQFDYRSLVSFPRGRYDEIEARVQLVYARYPIAPALPIELVHANDGTVHIAGSHGGSIDAPNALEDDDGVAIPL